MLVEWRYSCEAMREEVGGLLRFRIRGYVVRAVRDVRAQNAKGECSRFAEENLLARGVCTRSLTDPGFIFAAPEHAEE